MKKLVVYTALFSHDPDNLIYGDIIHYQHEKNSNVDYVCFTNIKQLQSNIWDIRYIDEIWKDARNTSRQFKVLPQKYLPEYENWLWMDAQCYFMYDPLSLCEYYLNNVDIAVHIHSDRNCIYQEGHICNMRSENRDPAGLLMKQLDYYKQNGYPENGGLYENGVLFRKNNKLVCNINEQWWKHIKDWTTEDQISFTYVCSQYKNLKIYGIDDAICEHRPILITKKSEHFATVPRHWRNISNGYEQHPSYCI